MVMFALARKAPMKRRLFAAGRVRPPYPFGNTGCKVGKHLGEPLDVRKMDAAGGIWADQATCSRCFATVGRDEFVQAAAVDDNLRRMGSE